MLKYRQGGMMLRLDRFSPIHPKLRAPFDNSEWLYEPKLDGYRAIYYQSEGRSRFRSREDKYFSEYQKLADELRMQLNVRSLILDGEMVVIHPESGLSSFKLLQRSRGRNCLYQAFDLLYLNGEDLRRLPLLERKKHLETLLNGKKGICYVRHVEEIGIAFFEAAKLAKIEGIVAKRKTDSYHGRTRWYKIKNRDYKRQ